MGPRYAVIPALPFLPALPWLAYAFGALWLACAVSLLAPRTVRAAAMACGGLLFACAVVLEAPKYAAALGVIGLRTVVFEPLALACLAWLLPGRHAIPGWLERAGRYLLALSLVVFGYDHFPALAFTAALIPAWIPWHVFWTAFFGVAFIAAGLSIGLDRLLRAAAFSTGAMFGIWVLTLHLPRVLGLYGIPGAPFNPDEWSSLSVAVGLWGGCWALARA